MSEQKNNKYEKPQKPIALGALSEERFNALMEQSMYEYETGQCRPIEEFHNELRKEFGL